MTLGRPLDALPDRWRIALVLGVGLLLLLGASPLVGQGHAEQKRQGAVSRAAPAYANPHGVVVSFLFPGLPFRVLDLTRDQKTRMARHTARLHRGYGHDLHHLYHGGGVSGLFRALPHLRHQVQTYRRNILDGVLSEDQREKLAAAFDEEAFDRNRHGYRVLRTVLGSDVVGDRYGIPDRHGVGTGHLGFEDSHGPGHESRRADHAGGPPPR